MSMRARSIVAIVVGATVLLILGGVLAVFMNGGERSVGALTSRSYTSGKSALFLETQTGTQYLGPLSSFTGCEPRGVVEELSAAQAQQQAGFRKQLSGVEVEPCEITFGAALMQQPMYDWLSDTLGGTATAKTVWIVEANYNGQPQDAVKLTGVKLAKIVFPEANASDPHPSAEISASLRATSAEHPYPCCGGFSGSVGSATTTSSKIARTAYFTFDLGGLPTQRVASVSPLVVTQDASGEVHFGDIEVSVALIDTGPWAQWFKQFAIQGNNQNSRETGRLAFTNATKTSDLLVINLQGVGIYRRGPDTPGTGTTSQYTQTARDLYSLFVESATMTGPPQTGGGTTSQSTSTQTTTAQTTTAQTTTAQTTTAQTTTAQTTTATTTTIPAPPQPPPVGGTVAAPEGLEARGGESQAALVWQPVEGATGYVILMSLSPREEFKQVGEAGAEKEPSFTAEKLEPGRTYYFAVRAVRKDEQSENSKVVQVDIK
jgi:fibronectin type III domain protein